MFDFILARLLLSSSGIVLFLAPNCFDFIASATDLRGEGVERDGKVYLWLSDRLAVGEFAFEVSWNPSISGTEFFFMVDDFDFFGSATELCLEEVEKDWKVYLRLSDRLAVDEFASELSSN